MRSDEMRAVLHRLDTEANRAAKAATVPDKSLAPLLSGREIEFRHSDDGYRAVRGRVELGCIVFDLVRVEDELDN